jgi:hypothetical protein
MFDSAQLKRLLREVRITISWLSEAAENKKNPPHNQLATSEESKDVNEPPSLCSKPTPSQEPNKTPKAKWYQSIDGVRLALEFIVFAVACFYALIYYGQLQAAKAQASAAEKQIQEMREQRMLDERAWVSVYEFNDAPDFRSVLVAYKNVGKTPALNVRTAIFLSSDPKWIPVYDDKPTNAYKVMLFPNDQRYSARLFASTNNLIVGSYVFGTIWYDDIFGSNHWVQFCRIWTENEAQMTGIHNSCDDADTNNPYQNGVLMPTYRNIATEREKAIEIPN